MSKLYLFVEGHGEVDAAGNLVTRAWHGIGGTLPRCSPMRWKNLHLQTGVAKAAEYARQQADAAGMLILRDEDDACPAQTGPQLAAWLDAARLPFPAAGVLMHREYEVLFLPCLPMMAGQLLGVGAAARPAIRAGTSWPHPTWESKRDIKGWISEQYVRSGYKPTIDH